MDFNNKDTNTRMIANDTNNANNKWIEEKLKEIKDPELGIDIVTLGLIRGISLDDDGLGAEVLITFTSPTCPFADKLIEDVENAIKTLGFKEARVEVAFDPPWEPPAELRAILGF